ncbi:putative Sin3 binding protein-domain-containing protein [Calycina marina]|uniref:Sin3 binding protein-domain-containing protein n=1 Tax=Calycina marina TaxID=1763456 RepID=A0A9P7ZAY1_9HELO|nr:putative Sin3 binding protein-domain-containing protein [Calycina marina]
MAAMTSTARDIPKASGRDNLTAVAARSFPAMKGHPLPTPPNSISPSLPPHSLKPYGPRSTIIQVVLEQVDSDLDLKGEHTSTGNDSDMGHDVGSYGLDALGDITTSFLAKHHLPDILLAHGPLAIRHIMGYLTTSVPGFSGIPPTKARRLVVGALEARDNGGDIGGVNGEVKFEKVGWGRWDARPLGQPGRGRSQHSPPTSNQSSYSVGMPIIKTGGYSFDRTRLNPPVSSWTGDSAIFSHNDDMDINMAENEADKMSLDGSCSSSEATPEDEVMAEDDPDDVTDDEDWAAVGAAALRAASYASAKGRNFSNPGVYNGGSHGGGGPSLSTMAKSVPLRNSLLQPPNMNLQAFTIPSNPQEQEAIEALLRLGSV